MDYVQLLSTLICISLSYPATQADSIYDLEYRGEACEGAYAVYTCPVGYYIKVMAASYGRSDNSTCTESVPDGKETELMCDVGGALEVLQEKCDGGQSCAIDVNAWTFNDTTCTNVHNYMDIVYICEAGLYSALACEGYKLTLSCPADEVLHINSLEYGRSDNYTCQHESINMTDCTTTEPFDHVSELCNGNKDCVMFIYDNLLGDPCPGTYKYLLLDHLCGTCTNVQNDADCNYYAEIGECERNVNWMAANCRKSCWNCKHADKCLDRQESCAYWASIGECHVNPGWMTTNCRKSCNRCDLLVETTPDKQAPATNSLCEGNYLQMNCNPSYSLRIEDIQFGRWDNSTCPGESVNDTSFDCPTPEDTLELVQRVCNGRADCWYEARVELFGDPCPGMNKQSEVTFTCQKCEDSFEESECEALKAAGRCEDDYDWMMDYCFQTCTQCHYRDCGNQADQGKTIYDCDYWAMLGYCDTNRDNVHEKCATSCQKCELPEPTTTPVPVPDGPKSIEICETDVELLQCPTDLHIQIDSVFFGRDDNVTCPHTSIYNLNCTTQERSESTVRLLCDGRTECHFEANSIILGDPCPGTFKVGRVIYTCKECENNASDAECEEILTNGQCTEDYVHSMRKCYKTCSGCEHGVCGNAHENKVECDFSAARGDCETRPNPMHVDCQESCGRCAVPNPDQLDSEERHMCEVQSSLISCPIDYYLHINSMFFGRQGNDTCHHDSVVYLNCSTPDGALDNLRTLCNGRKQCWFEARSELWGDNCRDTFKTAWVNYTCQVCANTASDSSCQLKAANGLCDEDYDYMTENCYKTCTGCDTSSCGTEHSSLEECDYWAARGECPVNPKFMLNKCKESCRACVEPETTTQPPSTTTPHPDQLEPVREDICEGQVKQMVCPASYYLRVRDIFFGRVDPDICPHESILDTDCQTPEGSLKRFQLVCDGRSSCWFEAKSWVWGDNCGDTFKTGSVEYSCQLCKNLDTDSRCDELAAEGKCKTEYDYMMNHCFKACSSCAGPSCNNVHISDMACDSWSIAGECTANPNYMLGQCPASCRVCEDQMTTTPPPLVTTTASCGCHDDHGQCVDDQCVCEEGWTGDTCDTFHCKEVQDCTGHGRCYGPNQCACEPYYEGPDCSNCTVIFQAGGACLPCPFCQQGSCAEDPSEPLLSSYVGCFADNEASREHSYMESLSSGQASPALCINTCAMKGYKYAALQGNDRCLCGQSFGKYGPSSDCNTLCSEFTDQICGGILANSVYRTWQGRCACLSGWEGEFCTDCVVPECEMTTTAVVPATSPFTLNIVLQVEWKLIYSNLNNPETVVFTQDIAASLLTFYQELDPKTSKVEIVQLRQGSVKVEHLVWFIQSMNKVDQDDLECEVYQKLTNEGRIGDREAKVGDRMAENCAWRMDYCQNGGELYRSDNVWQCRCPSDTRGDQCESSKLELSILIAIIVACCVVFIIIFVVLICCLHRRKKKQKESEESKTRAILSDASSANISTANTTSNLKDPMELSYQYPDFTEGTGNGATGGDGGGGSVEKSGTSNGVHNDYGEMRM